jgi:8-oxo-dGTP diphosphatase
MAGNTMNSNTTRVTAAILAHHGRILIAQRRSPDNLAGKWEFPGGKIENHETPQQCLIREMKEEFDIDIAVGDFFDESLYHDESGTIQLLAYHTTWKSGCISLKAHAAMRWVSLSQMQKIEFAPADMPIAEKLQHRPIAH